MTASHPQVAASHVDRPLRAVFGLARIHRHQGIAPLVARTLSGLVLLLHGLQKIIDGSSGFAAFLQHQLGVPAPALMAWVVALLETVGGAFLLIGLVSRLMAALLTLHLTVAIALVSGDVGFFSPVSAPASDYGSGVDFALMVIAALLVVVLAGPGPLAVDRVIGLERGGAPADPRPAGGGKASRPAIAQPSAVRAAAVSGLIGGVFGAVMSALANYAVVGMPSGVGANATNHAVTGLISGFLAGFIGVLMHQRRSSTPAARNTTTHEVSGS
ncbi:DoxX family protein [Streptomyces sp. DG2A-72]|uniref:DoxX family protein n=1 Tax=Streptomyces sp. DG2A-72 TaxID=3051386 RepID=UPI00265C0E2F|nr:DoxX family protein [Streptomyces sp. DG2A-72]MDO0932231.1 DoxX family protein [Streptomyces sp. DG2A-72]